MQKLSVYEILRIQSIMKKRNLLTLSLLISVLFFDPVIGTAQKVDLSKSKIFFNANAHSEIFNTAIRTLREEVNKRTNLNLQVGFQKPNETCIILATKDDERVNGVIIPKHPGQNLSEMKPEGYRIFCETQNSRKFLWIIGCDDRGVLFGIGK